MTWLNINTVKKSLLATENTNDTLIRLPKQFICENDSSVHHKKLKQHSNKRDRE